MDKYETKLRNRILNDLKDQGYQIYINPDTNEAYLADIIQTKSEFKRIFEKSKYESKVKFRDFIIDNYEIAKNSMAKNGDIDPAKIEVELIETEGGSVEDTLLKWWSLVWWNNPFQPFIFRQMRYLIWDRYHNNLIGILILQNNIIMQKVRDDYLKLNKSTYGSGYYMKILNDSLYAQRLGAIPPYNRLLGGKLVAYSMLCNELRDRFIEKYIKYPNLFDDQTKIPRLLYISTTSMFGRSSIYNRLKYYDEKAGISLGYSSGFGTFQFSNEIYNELRKLLLKKMIEGKKTKKVVARKLWIIKSGLRFLKLGHLIEHKLKKESFIFPMVDNLLEVIHDKTDPIYKDRPLIELVNWWKNRWGIPRSKRKPEYKDFDREKYFKNDVNYFISKLDELSNISKYKSNQISLL